MLPCFARSSSIPPELSPRGFTKNVCYMILGEVFKPLVAKIGCRTENREDLRKSRENAPRKSPQCPPRKPPPNVPNTSERAISLHPSLKGGGVRSKSVNLSQYAFYGTVSPHLSDTNFGGFLASSSRILAAESRSGIEPVIRSTEYR